MPNLLRRLLPALFACAAAAAAPAAAVPTSDDPLFGPRTLYGWGPWLAGFDGPPPLGVGEPVDVFAAGRQPAQATIAAVTRKGAPGYVKAGLLARGPDAPPRVVALRGAVPADAPLLAVRALAPFHKRVGGVAKRAVPARGDREVANLLGRARVGLRAEALIAATRYRTPGQPEILDLYLGKPAWLPGRKAMRQVDVQRLTFVGGKHVGTQGYRRVAGQPERAEGPPVALTAASWAETSERTLGFVGVPDGRWYRLSADVGPEGIRYRIVGLAGGAVAYDAYHYTPH